jgi:phosphoglycolate phosphatase-like HAD superfamily hydrolase
MKPRLALFDIDGTLLTTNGRAVQAMMAALETVYNVRPESDGYLMDGKTELRIVHELLEQMGLDHEAVRSRLPEFWRRYARELEARVHPATTTVYIGVRELISRLREEPSVTVGLLTGNCAAAARIKLEAAGLAEAFAFGAFGQDEEDRNALPAVALAEAERRIGVRLGGQSVSILGDTPNDVACARPLGLRAIAVATGRYGSEALAACGPDYLFADFSDAEAVMRAVFEDRKP